MFMNRSLTIFFIIISLNISVFAATNNEVTEKDNKLTIYSSIIPLQFFVDKIGGERVNSSVLVGPGKSPTTYQPTPKQIVGLSGASVLFTVGVPFEKAYLGKTISTLKDLTVIDSAKNIEKHEITGHHGHGDEDEEEQNDADNLDPHVWLSPKLSMIIARNILNALIEVDQEGKEQYTKAYDNLIIELKQTELKISELLTPLNGKTVFVYHPSFGYLFDDYGITQEAVETGGKEPTPAQLESIIKEARNDEVKIIIVQPEFSKKSAEVIASAIDGSVTTLNPLEYDYCTNLVSIATTLASVY